MSDLSSLGHSRRRLLIRPGALGDCLLSLPALQHLRTEYTEIWAPSAVVPLLSFADAAYSLASTGLDMVGIGDLPMPEPLRARLRSFDSIVSWYGSNRPEFREAIQSLGIPCLFHPALPPPSYGRHAVDFFADQAGDSSGLIPHLNIQPLGNRNTIVIHPFSGGARKNWPLSSFRQLACRLPLPVEWSAGPEEELPEARRFDSLRDLARWLAGARLYIGNDSGITHLAAALGLPVLALFGPTAPEVWGPRGARVSILRNQPLAGLSGDTVLEAANRLLG